MWQHKHNHRKVNGHKEVISDTQYPNNRENDDAKGRQGENSTKMSVNSWEVNSRSWMRSQ